MYRDYEKLVKMDYERKKNHHILRSELVAPTRAKIKKECVRLCRGKLQAYDEKVIRDFCDEWDDSKTCLQNIINYEEGKFYALAKFMMGLTETTDAKNVQLLAWLIDFPHRPYDYAKNYSHLIEFQNATALMEAPTKADPVKAFLSPDAPGSAPIEGSEIVCGTFIGVGPNMGGLIGDGQSNEPEDVQDKGGSVTPDVVGGSPEIGRRRRRFKMIFIVGALLIVTALGSWWWSSAAMGGDMGRNGGCMYWNVDHYEPVACDKRMPNTLVIALDPEKVKYFRKIMQPDTITNRAKGHVWYSKINNKVEFFTAEGYHPVVIDRFLKPVTDYMIDKYVHPGMVVN